MDERCTASGGCFIEKTYDPYKCDCIYNTKAKRYNNCQYDEEVIPLQLETEVTITAKEWIRLNKSEIQYKELVAMLTKWLNNPVVDDPYFALAQTGIECILSASMEDRQV